MFSSRSVLQFATTVAHLRRQQLAGQVRNRVRLLYERPEKFAARPLPAFGGCRWRPECDFLPPGPQDNCAANMLDGRFRFLNSEKNVGRPPDWNRADLPKLWLYNLHYFEYLWTLDYEAAKSLVSDWMERHTLRQGRLGWEPYPTSLRLVNLCGIFFGKWRRRTEDDSDFRDRLWASIFLQTQWLSEHLETHLLGNHLFENGAALAVVGSCFSGGVAERWLRSGKSILEKEIPEQILGDGMHFERSPMYHCRIVYLLALLHNTGHPELVDLVREPLKRSLDALGRLTHPDGRIALLNDSAFAVCNAPGQLATYVRRLLGDEQSENKTAAGPFALPDAGYYGFRDDAGTYIVCDAGRIGPDYIPGHAHADMFSFELSMKERRVIVDSGVYDYEASPMRRYCRSTKAHNTVEIEGFDQCDMWASFRVGRRGYPRDVQWLPSDEGFCLEGWHDGYKRLKGRPKHSRQFNWSKSGELVVADKIIASCQQNIVSRIHLHPDCSVEHLHDDRAEVSYPAGRFAVSFHGKGRLTVEESLYCPHFGRKYDNAALAYCVSGPHISISTHIQKLSG